ncbi:hypothetical protein V2J09_010285 [Rumex salicifolius]
MAYNAAHEDSFHILFQCQKIISLLASINIDTYRFILSNVGNYDNTMDFIDTIQRTMKKYQFLELITTWWSIWYSRNQKAFRANQNDESVVHDLKGFINSQIREWEKNKKWTSDIDDDTITNTTTKMKQRQKQNGSTKDSGTSALGVVIRNHNCGVSTALKTEALVVRDCLVLAKKIKLEKIIVESDSLTVVKSLQSFTSDILGILKCPWDLEVSLGY